MRRSFKVLGLLVILAGVTVLTSPSAVSSPRGPANAVRHVGHIRVPGRTAYAIATNPATHTVYAGNTDTSDVYVIDERTDKVTTTASGGCCGQYGIAANPATNQIYVSGIDDGVYRIDGATDTTTPVSSDYSPSSIVVDQRTDRIYVSAFCGSELTDCVDVLNGATGSIVHRIMIGSVIAVNPVTNLGYVLRTGFATRPDIIAVVDLSTDTIVKRIRASASWIAVNPRTNRVYAANDTRLLVINGATNAVVASHNFQPPSDQPPVLDASTNRLYFIDFTAQTLVAVRARTGSVVATVPTSGPPQGLTVDPRTGRIFVATAGHGIDVFAG